MIHCINYEKMCYNWQFHGWCIQYLLLYGKIYYWGRKSNKWIDSKYIYLSKKLLRILELQIEAFSLFIRLKMIKDELYNFKPESIYSCSDCSCRIKLICALLKLICYYTYYSISTSFFVHSLISWISIWSRNLSCW